MLMAALSAKRVGYCKQERVKAQQAHRLVVDRKSQHGFAVTLVCYTHQKLPREESARDHRPTHVDHAPVCMQQSSAQHMHQGDLNEYIDMVMTMCVV